MSSNKNGIFCERCPVRTACDWESRPVDISDERRTATTSQQRHFVGSDQQAVVHDLIDDKGAPVGEVVVEASFTADEVREGFSECWGPLGNRIEISSRWVPNFIRKATARIQLGRQCVGYAMMEQEAAWRQDEFKR